MQRFETIFQIWKTLVSFRLEVKPFVILMYAAYGNQILSLVCLPVLRNIEAPLEIQVLFLVVIYERAECGVIATGQHS